MFLNVISKRNPKLIESCVNLHQEGIIPPNTYVVDVDSVIKNARLLVNKSRDYGLSLYFMTKQFGREPLLSKLIAQQGITKAVAIDMEETRRLYDAGITLGHVGHLVQPGKKEWIDLLKMDPEVITVFSLERAKQLSEVAKSLGKVQNILLRVTDKRDYTYPAPIGGIDIKDLQNVTNNIIKLSNIKLQGITSFPLFKMDTEACKPIFTPNLETLLEAKAIIEEEGVQVLQVNGPGMTSVSTIPLLKQAGVTHGEPGHAFTGTTPFHSIEDDSLEMPAIAYVSEVSHQDSLQSYVIGGGFYAQSHAKEALVGSNFPDLMENRVPLITPSPGYIDYYGILDRVKGIQVGDTAVFSFRTQAFVTRAHIALVQGVENGCPKVISFTRRG
ncbi:alanine racemase [Bacillus cereus]|uniref:Alanine racemase N-terminal domain-containing protein n=1 Tax=Bacillus thuringiensis TaxID=1428 RepID=A0AAW4I1P0_BACTU|nr:MULTISPECIES: alanine racemase [Bacillus cereus group]EOO05586.1 hypothetical protein IAW_05252 [Bacillus cereus str. Schrouff]EOO82085.1 hypothetical protein IGY_05345 [Bacillus cereus K-5975c]MBJ8090601.1 alanine racemase [Bacillus cereus]MBN9901726.1 hypothetical protein [Bacillus thuringiensis]MCM3223895.1 alanine racemase [Bacillus cereus]